MTRSLIDIARARRPFDPMECCEDGVISVENGLEGDRRGRFGDRQVTLLAEAHWKAACRDLDVDLPWTARRANLFVKGEIIPNIPGTRLRIGAVELEVTEELRPCMRMDKAHTGLRAALESDGRGGCACKVLRGGTIRRHDLVEILD